jgi:dephospho-CoA kinase
MSKNKLKIIGLTGGIASGKTAASDWFAEQGINIVDADIVARQVVEKGSLLLTEIAEHFQNQIGENVLLESGELDRAKLRQIIFSDKQHKSWLEKAMHPVIRADIKRQLDLNKSNNQLSSEYQIFVSPLLFETGQESMCEGVLLISANEDMQLTRLLTRDNCDAVQAKAIIASQMPLAEKEALAQWQIDNSSDLNALHKALEQFHTHQMDKQK